MIDHRFNPLTRQHLITIDAEEIERAGQQVMGFRQEIPPEVIDRVFQVALDHQFQIRNDVNAKRLRHFRQRFGPAFTVTMLPRGNHDEYTRTLLPPRGAVCR